MVSPLPTGSSVPSPDLSEPTAPISRRESGTDPARPPGVSLRTSTPFYFGMADRPILGLFDPARGRPKNRGVVFCHSLWREYARSYRAARLLARRVSSEGVHVLRFDYGGTGDSGGSDVTLAAPDWIDDLGLAIEELRSITGVSKVTLVGLRFGALMALLGGLTHPLVDSLVLWDPVWSGHDFLEQSADMHHRYMKRLRGQIEIAEPGLGEILGFPATSRLMNSIAILDTAGTVGGATNELDTTVWLGADAPRDTPVPEGATRRLLPDPTHWNSVEHVDRPLVVPNSIRDLTGSILEIAG